MAGHIARDNSNSKAMTKTDDGDDPATEPDADDEIVDLVSMGGDQAFTGFFALGAMVGPYEWT